MSGVEVSGQIKFGHSSTNEIKLTIFDEGGGALGDLTIRGGNNEVVDYNLEVNNPTDGGELTLEFLTASTTEQTNFTIVSMEVYTGTSFTEEVPNFIKTPEVLAYNDYFPYGSLLPNRHGQSQNYRYGFIGAENDNEISGNGSSQDHMYRSYDSRIGRYRSLDPLARNFPWNSPFAYAENRVIDGIDLEGREWFVKREGNKVHFHVKLDVIDETSVMEKFEVENLVEQLKKDFVTTYTQYDKDNDVHYSASIEANIIPKRKKDDSPFYMYLTDDNTKLVNGKLTNKGVSRSESFEWGLTEPNGGMMAKRAKMKVVAQMTDINGKKIEPKIKFLISIALHELGHAAGLYHPWSKENKIMKIKQGPTSGILAPEAKGNEKIIKNNLMNSNENPNVPLRPGMNPGRNLLPEQFEIMEQNINSSGEPKEPSMPVTLP